MSFKPLIPFKATQIITPFHNSRFLANHDIGQGFQPILKLLNVPLVYVDCRISLSRQKFIFFPFYCVSMDVFVLVYDQKLYILDMRIMTPYLLPPDLLHCEITLQNTTFKRKTSQLIYPYFLPNVFLYQYYFIEY